MLITKADGEQEEFDPGKLRHSLKKAGAESSEIDRIVGNIESTITEGERTQTIYRKAFELLAQGESHIAAKYSLRRAVFGLGPTGFPFEDFLALIFEAEGYKTKKRIIIRGACAEHEIDVAAYKGDHSFVAEAKFHMRPGIKSDLQVALYSYARFLDLESRPVCDEDMCGIKMLYVITNTKFTTAALDYANCTGIELLSWDYPKDCGLEDRIAATGFYPVSVLTGLSIAQKQRLLENGTILCREITHDPQKLRELGISGSKVDEILSEAGKLCGSK